MEAIVLAGGFGTRLSRVVKDVPKPMADISGRPFLEILLDSLAQKGFDRVILSVGFMAETIISYFGLSHAGLELVYSNEDCPLGTGGGVRLAIEKIVGDHVFIFNGDTFLDLEVDKLEQQWCDRSRPIIVCKNVLDTSRFGRLITNGAIVSGFAEKAAKGAGLINAGCYLLKKYQLCDFPLGRAFSLEEDFLAPAIARGEFDIFITHGKFIDIGVPDDYFRARNELRDL